MAKLVSKLSNEMMKMVPATEKKGGKADPVDHLEKYKELKKGNEAFEVIFSFIDPNGDLIAKDESGVTIILKGDDLSKELSYYNEKRHGLFLGSAFTVKVSSVDEENNTVHVKNGRSQRSSVKNQVIREIMKEIKDDKKLKIVGRVMQVNRKRVLVDVLGKGILGICEVKHWSKSYVKYLDEACKKGDVLEFDIIGTMPKEEKYNQIAFSLSREAYEADAWKEVPAEYSKPDAVIVVRCVDVPQGKEHWWGVSGMIPGIELMGDFTRKYGKASLIKGVTYKCKITQVDLDAHVFKVVPFEVADSDADTVNAVRMFNGNKIKKTTISDKKKTSL
jgi:hypothetical protein